MTPSRTLSTSPSDDGDEDDENAAPQSASYFRPRTLAGYTRYLEYVAWLYLRSSLCGHQGR